MEVGVVVVVGDLVDVDADVVVGVGSEREPKHQRIWRGGGLENENLTWWCCC